jgi:hypothetical protein
MIFYLWLCPIANRLGSVMLTTEMELILSLSDDHLGGVRLVECRALATPF